MLLNVLTDFPERLKPGAKVYAGDSHELVEIRSRREHKGGLLISLKGIRTPEEAGKWTNQYLYVRSDDRPPLPEGEYYYHQLIGLQVVDEDGRVLGELVEVIGNPANDIYIVRPAQGAEILLPATEEVILDVNLEAGKIHVHLLPGLLQED